MGIIIAEFMPPPDVSTGVLRGPRELQNAPHPIVPQPLLID